MQRRMREIGADPRSAKAGWERRRRRPLFRAVAVDVAGALAPSPPSRRAPLTVLAVAEITRSTTSAAEQSTPADTHGAFKGLERQTTTALFASAPVAHADSPRISIVLAALAVGRLPIRAVLAGALLAKGGVLLCLCAADGASSGDAHRGARWLNALRSNPRARRAADTNLSRHEIEVSISKLRSACSAHPIARVVPPDSRVSSRLEFDVSEP